MPDMATLTTMGTVAAEHSGETGVPSTRAVTGQVVMPVPPPEVETLKLPASAVYDGPVGIAAMKEWADWLSESTMLPAVFQGRPANIAVAALRAQALNIPFFVGLNEIFVTDDGSVGMTALLTNYLMVRSGCRIVILRSDAEACMLSMTRPDRPGETLLSQWTIHEVVTAGLMGSEDTDTWRRYPADGLYARAVARMGRRHAPDLTLGMAYTREELAAITRDKNRQAQQAAGGDGLLVPEGVQALLTKLEDKSLTVAGCRNLHRQAAKSGWLELVCTADGRTVQQVIYDRGDLLAVVAMDTAAKPAENGAAGMTELDCGCDIDEFLMTGTHRAACDGVRR